MLPRHFHHNIGFYHIQLLHLVKAVKHKTTFKSGLDFLDIILESLQGCKVTLVNLLVASADTNLAASLEFTVQYIGAGDITDCRSLEKRESARH